MVEHNLPWHGRRVLVTGVTGFLGSAVARELLARGAEVVGMIHQRPASDFVQSGRVHFVHGRADNLFRLHSAMAVHEVSAVFHLATCDTSALVQAANLYSRRVPVVTARPSPHLAIARTEEVQERMSIARFGAVFGPGDRKLARVMNAPPADGPARDFVFVRDAALACLLAAETSVANGPTEYTFRSGWLLTERQMTAAIRDLSTSSCAIGVPDSAPLSNPLGWQPSQSLAESLSETLAWYRHSLQTGSGDSMRAAA